MKRNVLCAAMILLAGSVMAADKDDVSAAIAKLAAADNYSWKTSTTNMAAPGGGGGGGGGRRGGRGGGFGATEGKAQKDGLYYVKMPGFGGFGGGGGGGGGGAAPAATEAYMMSTNKGAISGADGWTSIADATKPADDGGGGGGFNPAMFTAIRVQGVKLPAVEAKDLLDKLKTVTMADGAYSGDLPEDAVKAMSAFGGFGGRGFGGGGGGAAPEITGAKGTVKFWVKDGVLVKYEYNVQGTRTINDQDRPFNTTTTVDVSDVGSSKITVPDDAKKKMS